MSAKKKKNFISKEHRGGGLISMANDVGQIAQKIFGDKGMAEIEIITNWENIVGKDLSSASQPMRVDFKADSRRNGTLHLACENGANALELGHRTPYIIDRVNSFFGYQAVAHIKIHQGFKTNHIESKSKATHNNEKKLVSEQEENYIKEVVSDIQSPDLRERLESLGKKILEENK